ncbi:hypothetical protein CSA37_01020 [Candidatus Fermentibacteria bacterium]|nr:MAG: hypothetical protein CSA37_01020 [Candidatus Fermentibacteria bacterium]
MRRRAFRQGEKEFICCFWILLTLSGRFETLCKLFPEQCAANRHLVDEGLAILKRQANQTEYQGNASSPVKKLSVFLNRRISDPTDTSTE